MPRSQILYEVCCSSPKDEWEPMGTMYSNRAEAEQELKERKPHYPTAFLARIVFTRMAEPPARRRLRAV